MAGTLDQNGLSQIRNKCLHPVAHRWPQYGIVFRGDHQRRLLEELLLPGAFFPASVDAAVPVQASAKARAFKCVDENLEIAVSQKPSMRPVRQPIEDAATRRTENSRRSALVERSQKIFGGLVEP